ncbi:NAD(P)H-dependent FMN reductase [Kribbella sp. VKM Ac-2527]|uniref:NAD(P)H-dependent FMN reductase n=1 Tax=Kribbella caucasensis TaxID=2512215 RepID=A0A4R6KJ94_9ACTN|nr:NAD(P)H-dependent oxidoreductase [Kribbella sp. VKM Ac-2527]TDO50532.1 NAD(P)H-dependent FMN reductase [Kribbella sp. VKM Ac-2527]
MSDNPLRLAVIIGSNREGRLAPVVANWFLGLVEAHPSYVLDLLDLAEVKLPETQAQKPAFLGAYDSPLVEAFAERIEAADAYVVITPEYNHGYPASLKHAIDSVYHEWKGKPVSFVSYGGVGGGMRAIEQLRLVFAELHTVTVRNTVCIPMARLAFDANGVPLEREPLETAAATLLTELGWWARALRSARSANGFPR